MLVESTLESRSRERRCSCENEIFFTFSWHENEHGMLCECDDYIAYSSFTKGELTVIIHIAFHFQARVTRFLLSWNGQNFAFLHHEMNTNANKNVFTWNIKSIRSNADVEESKESVKFSSQTMPCKDKP